MTREKLIHHLESLREKHDDLDKEINLSEYYYNDKENQSWIYSLYAINCHIGNKNSGHYYSICKNLNNNWYMYNDENIKEIKNNISNYSSDCYILFYHRMFINKKIEI